MSNENWKEDGSDQLLTKDEAYGIAECIDNTLIDHIRDNLDIDNMKWLVNMVNAFQKLSEYGGYRDWI